MFAIPVRLIGPYRAPAPAALSRSFISARYGLRAQGLCLAIAALAFQAHAQNQLGFEQAIRLAETRSRQLGAQTSAAASARAMAAAAAQRPDPTLKLGVNNLPVDGPDRFSLTRDFMTMQSVGVMQEFTREDKRLARSRRFESEAQASEAARALALANLQRDTATAWLDCFYLTRMLDLLAAQGREAPLQVEAAEAAYRGGKGAQADVFAARTMAVQIEDRLAQVRRQLSVARTQLARWIGDAAQVPLPPVPPDLRHLPDHADLENEVQKHPDIVLMARQEDMAQADADAAQANKRADWSVELMLNHRGPAYSNMVSLNVAVPLQWDQANRQDRELVAKLATADQIRAQREEATREHIAQIEGLHQTWQSHRERLARYDASLLPLAAQRTEAALAAYRGGTGTLASVLEARRAVIDTQLERLRLEMDAAQAWAQLAYLIPASDDTPAPHP
ncbi:TolC family protein [Aquabacterium sp. NJ1]|uniref:TolC family protein n=1 Tax=Aquabacterium sp. NJ1 TaxID=1538295 RepID=UPI0009E0AE94|nr:TolC family protein [Aquabacterium sp. NJ1]